MELPPGTLLEKVKAELPGLGLAQVSKKLASLLNPLGLVPRRARRAEGKPVGVCPEPRSAPGPPGPLRRAG